MRVHHLLLSVALAVAATSCKNVVEYNEDWCLDPGYQHPFDVKVRVDDRFYHYQAIDSTNYDIFTRGELTKASTSWRLQYYVAAYNKESSTDPVSVFQSSDSIVKVMLHPGKYTLAAWADYVPQVQSRSYYYNLDDFWEIMLKNKVNYQGNDPNKIPYRGTAPVKVSYDLTETLVNAKPAMGGYRIVPNDTASYDIGKVIVYYLTPLPAAVDGFSGKISYKWTDISFETMPDGEILAQDFILGQDDEETVITCRIEVYNKQGGLCARSSKLQIPIVNGGITTVDGNFYTMLNLDGLSGGGISIKTEFDEIVEIEI